VTPLGAASAATTCPACGVGTPAAARFCPGRGERLLGGVEERRVLTVRFEQATGMGAQALVRRLGREVGT
jgi:hypothetical protein